MDQSSEDVAFTAFRRAHWPKVYSTNPLERANKEIERCDQGRGIFPNEAAVSGWPAPGWPTFMTNVKSPTALHLRSLIALLTTTYDRTSERSTFGSARHTSA